MGLGASAHAALAEDPCHGRDNPPEGGGERLDAHLAAASARLRAIRASFSWPYEAGDDPRGDGVALPLERMAEMLLPGERALEQGWVRRANGEYFVASTEPFGRWPSLRPYAGLNSHLMLIEPSAQLFRVLTDLGRHRGYVPYTNGEQDEVEKTTISAVDVISFNPLAKILGPWQDYLATSFVLPARFASDLLSWEDPFVTTWLYGGLVGLMLACLVVPCAGADRIRKPRGAARRSLHIRQWGCSRECPSRHAACPAGRRAAHRRRSVLRLCCLTCLPCVAKPA